MSLTLINAKFENSMTQQRNIGFGRTEISCFQEGVGMMGYGMYKNRVEKKGDPIYSRAIVFKEDDQISFAFVCAEIAFITPALRREVIKKCNVAFPDFNPSSLIVNAQHTHSAPGGYSEYALYNITIPGFKPFVFNAVVESIFQSIVTAFNDAKEQALKFAVKQIDPDLNIAFNRSRKAYNANPENESITKKECRKGIDTRMRSLIVEDEEKVSGILNWFGVHSTCIGNKNTTISSDNKGYASAHFEKKTRGAVGIFAQGIAGDVSPHYHGPKAKPKRKNIKGDAEFKFAKKNGHIQSKEALSMLELPGALDLNGTIDSEIIYVDFSDIKVEKEFSNDCENAVTAPACHGVAFFNGTPIDGRGLSDMLNFTAKGLSNVVKFGQNIAMPFKSNQRKLDWQEKYRIHGKKRILLDASEHRIFGTTDIKGLIIPAFADPTIAELKKEYINEALEEHSWVPHVLPLQIIIIGELAIVGCPGEFTVAAGKRLENSILKVLKNRGVKEVLLSTYSNAYMGYVTTYEEYQVQAYEGGHTIFGQWTLGAFQTKFNELASAMLKPKRERDLESVEPPTFSENEMSRRTYTS